MSSSVSNDTEKSVKSSFHYEDRLAFLSPISKPLATRSETKHIYKMIKTASKEKCIRRGVKEVLKALKKNIKGTCFLAGDISPIDVMTHLPVLCEERDILYIYVPRLLTVAYPRKTPFPHYSKDDLGAVSLTKRPTSCVFVLEPQEKSTYTKEYGKVTKEIEAVWKTVKF